MLFAISFLCACLFGIVLLFALKDKNVESGVYRVVNVMSDNGRNVSTGTAFKVAEPGIVVTNYHVIRGARTLVLLFNDEGRVVEMPVKVLWQDQDLDLAFLQTRKDIPGAALTLAEIGENDLHKRDEVEAIGFPGAADDLAKYSAVSAVSDVTFIDATVTTGTVQRQVASLTRATIQHSADVNSGNSGGPLLDSCQRVVGVNTLSKTAEIRADQMVEALSRNGVINFQAPGALESAVHVGEVIKALKDEKIGASLSSGRCYSGLDRGEVWTLGVTGAASLLAFAFAGAAVMLRGGHAASMIGAEEEFSEPVDRPGYTEIAPLAALDKLVLVRESDGARFDLSVHERLLRDGGVTIGRRGGEADLVIAEPSISRRHALVRRLPDGGLVIADLNSTNGTFIDGQAVPEGQEMVLGDGSDVVLGDSRFRLAVTYQGESGDAGRGDVATWLISGFDDDGHVFQHEFEQGANSAAGRDAVLVRIGRSEDNDLVFDHNSVSRNHATLFLSNDGSLCLADLNSSNGTFLNGRRIGSKPAVVMSGQNLQFGAISASLSRKI